VHTDGICCVAIGKHNSFLWLHRVSARADGSSVYIFQYDVVIFWVTRRDKVRFEGLGTLKKFNDLIWTRTCDLPACSVVPQPSMLSAPNRNEYQKILLEIKCWQPNRHLWSDCLGNMGSLTSHNTGLHGLLQGYSTLIAIFFHFLRIVMCCHKSTCVCKSHYMKLMRNCSWPWNSTSEQWLFSCEC
jgi:hypothetical protein